MRCCVFHSYRYLLIQSGQILLQSPSRTVSLLSSPYDPSGLCICSNLESAKESQSTIKISSNTSGEPNKREKERERFI